MEPTFVRFYRLFATKKAAPKDGFGLLMHYF